MCKEKKFNNNAFAKNLHQENWLVKFSRMRVQFLDIIINKNLKRKKIDEDSQSKTYFKQECKYLCKKKNYKYN